MRKALLLALLLSGCAAADRAQLADGVTTIIGLNAGFSEANPVWGHASGPVIAATKIGVTQVVKLTPPAVCEPGLLGLTVAGYGAAGLNLSTLLAGTFWYGVPLVLALSVWRWDAWIADAVQTCADPWPPFKASMERSPRPPVFFRDENR